MVELKQYSDEYFDAMMQLEKDLFPIDPWSPAIMRSELKWIGINRMYWVALVDGELAGFCGMRYDSPSADIQTIAVARSHWRQGIGRAMLEQMMRHALDCYCDSMMLEVKPDNEGAIALYREYGFEPIAERANYYGPGHSALVMRCRDIKAALHD